MKKILFIILLSAFANTSFAGVEKQFTVEGEVTKFTQDTVTLLVKGKSVEVPRGSIPTYYSVKTGYRVIAYLPREVVLGSKGTK